MQKEKKSARELAEMIAARMKIDAGLVSVDKHPTYGWAVQVFTGPARLFGDQPLAEQIAAELRERYDLTE
jgi:hypothetical protein